MSDREAATGRAGAAGSDAFACLAIETSSAVGSLALLAHGRLAERTIATPREQTSTLLALIDELLTKAGVALGELDAVAFGKGPGSFTGLRIAAALAQGFGYGSGVPIVPVSSLAALARRGLADFAALEPAAALCCVDARMGEVYRASFRAAATTPDSPERLGAPDEVVAPAGPFVGVGDGFRVHAEALAGVAGAAAGIDADAVPRAREILELAGIEFAAGRTVPVEAALPTYLRGADAWKRR